MKSIRNLAKIGVLASLGLGLTSLIGCKGEDTSKYSCEDIPIRKEKVSFENNLIIPNSFTYAHHTLNVTSNDSIKDYRKEFYFDNQDKFVDSYATGKSNEEDINRYEYSGYKENKVWDAIKDTVQAQAEWYLNQILIYKQTEAAKQDSLDDLENKKEVQRRLEHLKFKQAKIAKKDSLKNAETKEKIQKALNSLGN